MARAFSMKLTVLDEIDFDVDTVTAVVQARACLHKDSHYVGNQLGVWNFESVVGDGK